MAEERLQKILARYGVASRRKAEQLIIEGRVSVNGKTIVELGTKADAATDEIRVTGMHLRPPRQLLYVMLHKPKNCVTTVYDPQHRETVMDLVKGFKERIYPVGRLDYNSEGLLLLTNDGEFANAILSDKAKVPKTYEVKVNGHLTAEQEQQFRDGIPLHGKRTAPANLRLLKQGDNPWYEVEIVEGRQNQIRIMFRHFGLLVEKLRRTRIAFLKLGALKPCEFRLVKPEELKRFRGLLKLQGAG
jgi:23S rRNA pseudouridine2605 synthase